MKHRQRWGRAIRQVIMIHRNTGQARIGLLSNKYVPSLGTRPPREDGTGPPSREFVHVLALELLRLSE